MNNSLKSTFIGILSTASLLGFMFIGYILYEPSILGMTHCHFPTPPETYITTSKTSFAVIAPASKDRNATVSAYTINSENNPELLWRTSGWWSKDVRLSSDGRHLVRIHPINNQGKAISFYKDGALIKEYNLSHLTGETNTKPEFARPSVWGQVGPILSEFKIIAKTKNGHQYMFNIKNGDIIYKKEKT